MITDAPAPAPSYRSPGRPGLSQSNVDRAADTLLQQGQRPSIEKIRAAIGGSPNTLGPLLDDWWRRLAARVRVGPGAFERLPGSLAQIAEAFFMHALEEARRVAHQEEQRERHALIRDQQSMEVRSHVLTLREQELQARLQERERAVSALELQVREQTLLLRKLEASRATALARVEALETQITRVPRMVKQSRVKRPRPAARPKSRRAAARSKKVKRGLRGKRRRS